MNTTIIKVAAYHCDQMGHVNNAVYVDLLHQATYEIVSKELQGFLTPEALRLDYLSSAHYGDELTITSWITNSCEAYYQITDQNMQVLTKARIMWQRPPEDSGYWHMDIPYLPPPFALKNGNNHVDKTRGLPFKMSNYVYLHDLTTAGFIKASSLVRWTEGGSEVSAIKRGWPAQRMLQNNWITFAVSQDLQVFGTTDKLREVTIISYLHDFRTIRGTWRHDVVDTETNKLIARNFIGGAFLNLSGELTPAPEGLLEDCLLGEP